MAQAPQLLVVEHLGCTEITANMTEQPAIYGKNSKPLGKYPAIVLTNPKYSANVGGCR